MGYYNYIFDSCDISVEMQLDFFCGEDIIVLFLGYTEIKEEEAVRNYRKYETKNDRTCKRTDKE